jgi:hypothetical protein
MTDDKRLAFSMATSGRCKSGELEYRDYLSASRRCTSVRSFVRMMEWHVLDCGGLVSESTT